MISQPAGLAIVTAVSGTTAALGGGLSAALRRRSIVTILTASVLTSAVAVLVGVVVASLELGIGPRVAHLLWAATGAAGIVSAGVAFVGGWRITAGARKLQRALRELGDAGYLEAAAPPTAELAALATELAQVSKRLHEAQIRERSTERARRELVTWMSHDLRTPLTALRAMAETLDRDPLVDDTVVAGLHHGIRVESERLAGMIDELFDIAQIHAGTVATARERVPFSDLVSDAVAAVRPLAAGREIVIQGSTGFGLMVDVEPGALARALRNLFTNAIANTPRGGLVDVRTAAQDGRACVEIRDACGGIRAADLPRVFEPGYRGHPARVAQPPGSGLGLSIARGIMRAHGGDVDLVNTEVGCLCSAFVPLADARPGPPSTPDGQP